MNTTVKKYQPAIETEYATDKLENTATRKHFQQSGIIYEYEVSNDDVGHKVTVQNDMVRQGNEHLNVNVQSSAVILSTMRGGQKRVRKEPNFEDVSQHQWGR